MIDEAPAIFFWPTPASADCGSLRSHNLTLFVG